MKFFRLLCIAVLIGLTLSSCKKESKIEDPTGCNKYSSDAVQIKISGKDEAGASYEMAMDTLGKEIGLTYYWQLPDSSVYKGTTIKIDSLKKNHRGKYYAYYTAPNGCQSYKSPTEIKSPGISMADVPCKLPKNYIDIGGLNGSQNLTMPGANFSSHSEKLIYVACGAYPATPHVEILLNSYGEPGEYEIVATATPEYLDNSRKVALFSCGQPGSSENQWKIASGKLYLMKYSNKEYELVICDAEATHPSYTSTYIINMRLNSK